MEFERDLKKERTKERKKKKKKKKKKKVYNFWEWKKAKKKGQRSVEYLFTAVNRKYRVPLYCHYFQVHWHGAVVTVRVISMSQIYLFKTYSYSIGPCEQRKNSHKKQFYKNINMNEEGDSLTSSHKKCLDELTCH